jgi:hypothetical protein
MKSSAGDDNGGKAGLLPRTAWYLALFGPPPAAAGVWLRSVRAHPFLSLVLLLTYYVVLNAGRFVVGFGRELVRRRRPGWLESVDRALHRRLSRFRRQYLEYLANSLKVIDQKGLSTIGFYSPELDEVFIDIGLAPQAPGKVDRDLLSEYGFETAERRSLMEFVNQHTPAVIAVIGPPGSGKTTLLRHAVRRICRSQRRHRRPIPIILYLRDHAAEIIATPSVSLSDITPSTIGRHAAGEPPGWFEQQLRDGGCTVLLDGLDEVAVDQSRQSVADWIERQIAEYPKNDYVITSRPRGYESTPIAGATVLTTRRLTEEQISWFVSSWYAAVERHGAAGADGDVTIRAEKGAESLRARLRESPGLYELTVNPLLLTMIANVHRFRGSLPGSRVDLYGEICQVMLWRRQEAKKLTVEPRGRQKEMLLRRLAFEMMRRKTRDLSRDECLTILRSAAKGISRDFSAEAFLDDVGTNGLLIERENAVFAFTHFTFQEYLSAAQIRDKGLAHILTRSVDDDWWRECTLLYAANSDASPIVSACLRSGTVQALALAFECAEECNELEPELRGRLDDLLEGVTPQEPDLQRRRLVAGVLAAQRLRHIVHTSDGGRLCPLPITKNIYGYFLADMETQGVNRRPDASYRPGVSPGAETGDGVVLGVRADDAAAFAFWMNGLIGEKSFYRLPRRTEMEDRKTQRLLRASRTDEASPCFWIESPTGPDAADLWIPDESPHPHLVTYRLVREKVAADLGADPSALIALLLIRARSQVSTLLRLLDLAPDVNLDFALAQLTDLDTLIGTLIDGGLLDELDPGLNLVLGLDFELPRAREATTHLTANMAEGEVKDLTRVLALALVEDLSACIDLADDAHVAPDIGAIKSATHALSHDLSRYDIHAAVNETARVARHLGVVDVLGHEDTGDGDLSVDSRGARDRLHDLAVGSVLSESLAHALSRRAPGRRDPQAFVRDFVRRFLTNARLTDREEILRPEAFANDAATAVAELGRLLTGSASPLPSTLWAEKLAGTLSEAAGPIFERTGTLTSRTATSIRLSSLCLAVEADAREQPLLGDKFRRTAAAATWLELRTTGASPPTETILLASD